MRRLGPVDTVTVRAPAKVNLHLAVGRRRDDGYHELRTVFHAIGLYDDLTARHGDGITLTISGEGAGELPVDDTNLAVRAAHALAEHTGVDADAALELRKRIPVAGGCAGGSADAAAALVALDVLWGTELGRDELAEIAATLGSDVPFSLHGGTALGTGRGEQLTPVLGNGSYSWVLALADGGLSTPEVYAELDRQRETGPVAVVSDSAGALAALRQGSTTLLGRALGNDLQPAALALRPDLRKVLTAGDELGALGGVVSGSGPTVALLARDPDHATTLAAALSAEGVCRTVRTADGPVPGARVLTRSSEN